MATFIIPWMLYDHCYSRQAHAEYGETAGCEGDPVRKTPYLLSKMGGLVPTLVPILNITLDCDPEVSLGLVAPQGLVDSIRAKLHGAHWHPFIGTVH